MASSLVAALLLAAAADKAALAEFEHALAAQDSATLALEGWCAAKHIADPAEIHVSHRVTGSSNDPPRDIRRQLRIAKGDRLVMRHVDLSCGDVVLSQAWNYYVPERLTPEMNEALADTRVPFGKVVAPLRFHRETIEIVAGSADACPLDAVSTHRARLVLPDGTPLAYVVECYTRANLGR